MTFNYALNCLYAGHKVHMRGWVPGRHLVKDASLIREAKSSQIKEGKVTYKYGPVHMNDWDVINDVWEIMP